MEPEWLDETEQEAWRRLAGLFTVLPAALDAQLQRDVGLTLSEAPDRTLRMGCLAGLANGSLSRLSHVAGRLEKKGWLSRRPDPANGRYTLATLSESGWEKVLEAAPGHVGAVRRAVFDALTKAQVSQLHEIGERVLRSVEAARDS
jgi:DNA-binding MarR family transcriptional regulator